MRGDLERFSRISGLPALSGCAAVAGSRWAGEAFCLLLSILLSSVQKAVQTALDQIFANLCHRANSIRRVSTQAFYQARYKISAEVFSPIDQQRIALVEEYLPTLRWQVCAVDGSGRGSSRRSIFCARMICG